MIRVSPLDFLNSYLDCLRKQANWKQYDSKDWTHAAIRAAESVCKDFGLDVNKEYFRLDIAGREYESDRYRDNWHLRIAFEHEGGVCRGKDWRDELCKLTHVVADLRVLVGYELRSRGQLFDIIQERVSQMGKRMHRVPNGEWLFIFGSGDARSRWLEPWQAFTVNGRNRVVCLEADRPFCARDLHGFPGMGQRKLKAS